MRVLNSKNAAMVLALMLANIPMAYAQEDESSSKEEGNRNVMLNAASANGPREIQIGRRQTSMCSRTACLSPTRPTLIQ